MAASASLAVAAFAVPVWPASAARPFQVGPSEPTLAPGEGPLGSVLGWIAAQQAAFYRALTEALADFASDPSAVWLLIGLSLAYGVFHAAGPGHGKAVISSYVLADDRTARRAVALSFAAAFVQATTAVVLVLAATQLFRLTSVALNETAASIEVGSYALIVAIGLWLVWRKVLRPLTRALGARSRAPARRADLSAAAVASAPRGTAAHAGGCGHAHPHHHAVDPATLAAGSDWRSGAAVALSVGLRPCSGAIVVLVFALAQGMLAAGVASAYAMALGTGTTVALLASLAVGAKSLAGRLAGRGPRWSGRVLALVEAAAAVLVLALGLLLLAASLSA